MSFGRSDGRHCLRLLHFLGMACGLPSNALLHFGKAVSAVARRALHRDCKAEAARVRSHFSLSRGLWQFVAELSAHRTRFVLAFRCIGSTLAETKGNVALRVGGTRDF